MWWLSFCILSAAFLSPVFSQEDLSKCSASKACYQGCCSKDGNCGFGPDFCGDGCQGTCDAKAECGQYAPDGEQDCPINVCCRSVIRVNRSQKTIIDYFKVSTASVVSPKPFVGMAARKTAKVQDADNQSKSIHPA